MIVRTKGGSRKMGEEKMILELDKYESGVVFHSLNDKRNQMIDEGRPTDAVDDVLMKIIVLMEKGKRGRKLHEAR